MPYWDYYEPSTPRAVKGGIKAQSKGAFGTKWWAKRWMAVLDSYGLGARLTRGRSYARQGQVISVDVSNGTVHAKVQGSRPKPYAVSIQVKTLSAGEWDRVIAALAGQAIFAAKLLAGEMPQEIEEIFRAAGLSLFPEKTTDLATECSCPDWSNPCKHSAAVYCLLAETFDRDPFLIFTLRGMTRDEMLSRLTGLKPDTGETAPALPVEPLLADVETFWHAPSAPAELGGDVRRPPVVAPLLKRLGAFPFWRGHTPLTEAIEPIYSRSTPLGIDVYHGEMPGNASGQAGEPGRRT